MNLRRYVLPTPVEDEMTIERPCASMRSRRTAARRSVSSETMNLSCLSFSRTPVTSSKNCFGARLEDEGLFGDESAEQRFDVDAAAIGFVVEKTRRFTRAASSASYSSASTRA